MCIYVGTLPSAVCTVTAGNFSYSYSTKWAQLSLGSVYRKTEQISDIIKYRYRRRYLQYRIPTIKYRKSVRYFIIFSSFWIFFNFVFLYFCDCMWMCTGCRLGVINDNNYLPPRCPQAFCMLTATTHGKWLETMQATTNNYFDNLMYTTHYSLVQNCQTAILPSCSAASMKLGRCSSIAHYIVVSSNYWKSQCALHWRLISRQMSFPSRSLAVIISLDLIIIWSATRW